MEWTVETLNETVDRELRALPADMRARFAHICGLIGAVGLDRMGAPPSETRKSNEPSVRLRSRAKQRTPRRMTDRSCR